MKTTIFRAWVTVLVLIVPAVGEEIHEITVLTEKDFPQTNFYTLQRNDDEQGSFSTTILSQKAREIKFPPLRGYKYYINADWDADSLLANVGGDCLKEQRYMIPDSVNKAVIATVGRVQLHETNNQYFLDDGNTSPFLTLPAQAHPYALTPTARKDRIAAILDDENQKVTLALIDTRKKQVTNRLTFALSLFAQSELRWLNDRYLFFSSDHHNSASFAIIDTIKMRVVRSGRNYVERADSGKVYEPVDYQKGKLIFDPAKH